MQVLDRHQELTALGAEVVLIAFDRPGLLATKMMRGLTIPYVLVYDPDRVAYAAWGFGRTNLFGAMLSPSLNWRYLKLLVNGRRFLGFAPDMFQLGGDFVLDRAHRVAYMYRMRNNGDRAPVATLISHVAQVSGGSQVPYARGTVPNT